MGGAQPPYDPHDEDYPQSDPLATIMAAPQMDLPTTPRYLPGASHHSAKRSLTAPKWYGFPAANACHVLTMRCFFIVYSSFADLPTIYCVLSLPAPSTLSASPAQQLPLWRLNSGKVVVFLRCLVSYDALLRFS